MFNTALQIIRNIKKVKVIQNNLKNTDEDISKHKPKWHTKHAIAKSCAKFS